MSQIFDQIIKSGTCLITDPQGSLAEVETDIGIKDGKIASLGQFKESQSGSVFNAKGLHVLPGLIDTQVHFREPGLEHKETIASGSLGAILGGITGFFEMPNTNPSTTDAIALNDKLARAERSSWSNYSFFMGASPENADKLNDLEKIPGCCGVKVFMGSSTGNLLIEDLDLLELVLNNGQRRVAVHCEDEKRLKARKSMLEGNEGKVELHPLWRDEDTAFIASKNLIELAEKAQRRVHVLHVTTKQEMEFLKNHKKYATVECTPQHLTLSAPSCYEELGTLAQMNPPIRGIEHQEGLWQAILNGTVDVIGSDHAPHLLSEKNKPYPQSPSGMTGVQTTVPLMLNHVNQGRLPLKRLVELLATTPARIYGIKNKGHIKEGFDADFTVVDLKAKKVITNQWIQSRAGWTPFHGMKVQGWPVSTILNGKVVMRDGEVIGSPQGKAFDFNPLEPI